MTGRKKILLIGGSMNQTTMVTKIARHLSHHDLWFTPFYTTGVMSYLESQGFLEWTVAGSKHQQRSMEFLLDQGFQVDLRGSQGDYDLVITSTDLFIQSNIRRTKMILVQEGMTDPDNIAYYLARYAGLPRYLASTSTFGLSDHYVRLCAASDGYRDHFVSRGIQRSKVEVTGIPNFDNCAELLKTPFELMDREYVLVATSDSRETFKYENRRQFIRNAVRIADGRELVFKLHPNEKVDRATSEIRKWAPDAHIYHGMSIDPMIAHCSALITRFSSVVYIGIALGKEVHSEFPLEELQRRCPIQNGGRSAESIAAVCESVLEEGREFVSFSGFQAAWGS